MSDLRIPLPFGIKTADILSIFHIALGVPRLGPGHPNFRDFFVLSYSIWFVRGSYKA
jgi:hypothetical protein